MYVGFFGAGGVLFEANEVAVLVEEFFGFLGLVHFLPPFVGECIILFIG